MVDQFDLSRHRITMVDLKKILLPGASKENPYGLLDELISNAFSNNFFLKSTCIRRQMFDYDGLSKNRSSIDKPKKFFHCLSKAISMFYWMK
ncbi:hypothetical protein GJ496_002886 [Pomphorhynchus laevis]|nr:hypothetical protein GJ496_002886 [Pomphorhynchus laevis]